MAWGGVQTSFFSLCAPVRGALEVAVRVYDSDSLESQGLVVLKKVLFGVHGGREGSFGWGGRFSM